eukprot:COSAG03_NODE_6235_length_1093_cov_1.485915_1_plen_339_part_00
MQDMFDSWAIAFDQAALVRGRLLKAQTHFARQLLRFCKACFMEWAALMNSKAKMRNDALRKTVNKWSGKVLGYHFGHWAGLCARRRRINRALANVRMRVAGDLLSLVRLIFSEWAKVSDSSSRLRQMQVATVRRRLAKLLYGNCFKRWAMHSSAKVQALSAHIGSSNGTLLRKSFRQWVEALEEKHKHFDSVRNLGQQVKRRKVLFIQATVRSRHEHEWFYLCRLYCTSFIFYCGYFVPKSKLLSMVLNEDASATADPAPAAFRASSSSCSAAAFRSAAKSRPVADFFGFPLFLIIAQPPAARGEVPPEASGEFSRAVGETLPPLATRFSRRRSNSSK